MDSDLLKQQILNKVEFQCSYCLRQYTKGTVPSKTSTVNHRRSCPLSTTGVVTAMFLSSRVRVKWDVDVMWKRIRTSGMTLEVFLAKMAKSCAAVGNVGGGASVAVAGGSGDGGAGSGGGGASVAVRSGGGGAGGGASGGGSGDENEDEEEEEDDNNDIDNDNDDDSDSDSDVDDDGGPFDESGELHSDDELSEDEEVEHRNDEHNEDEGSQDAAAAPPATSAAAQAAPPHPVVSPSHAPHLVCDDAAESFLVEVYKAYNCNEHIWRLVQDFLQCMWTEKETKMHIDRARIPCAKCRAVPQISIKSRKDLLRPLQSYVAYLGMNFIKHPINFHPAWLKYVETFDKKANVAAFYHGRNLRSVVDLVIKRAKGAIVLDYEEPINGVIRHVWNTPRWKELCDQVHQTHGDDCGILACLFFYDSAAVARDVSISPVSFMLLGVNAAIREKLRLLVGLTQPPVVSGKSSEVRELRKHALLAVLEPFAKQLEDLSTKPFTVNLCGRDRRVVLAPYSISGDHLVRTFLSNVSGSAKARNSCAVCRQTTRRPAVMTPDHFPAPAIPPRNVDAIRGFLGSNPTFTIHTEDLRREGISATTNPFIPQWWFNFNISPADPLHMLQEGHPPSYWTAIPKTLAFVFADDDLRQELPHTASAAAALQEFGEVWGDCPCVRHLRKLRTFKYLHDKRPRLTGAVMLDQQTYFVYCSPVLGRTVAEPFFWLAHIVSFVRLQEHSEADLGKLDFCIQKFFSAAFVFMHAVKGKGFGPNMHSLTHIVESIRYLGSLITLGTEGGEAQHRLAKAAYMHTNKLDGYQDYLCAMLDCFLLKNESVDGTRVRRPKPLVPIPGCTTGRLAKFEGPTSTLISGADLEHYAGYLGAHAAITASLTLNDTVSGVRLFSRMWHSRENWPRPLNDCVKSNETAQLMDGSYAKVVGFIHVQYIQQLQLRCERVFAWVQPCSPVSQAAVGCTRARCCSCTLLAEGEYGFPRVRVDEERRLIGAEQVRRMVPLFVDPLHKQFFFVGTLYISHKLRSRV